MGICSLHECSIEINSQNNIVVLTCIVSFPVPGPFRALLSELWEVALNNA